VTSIHQLLPAAAPHDAITGQALSWRDLLRGWGYESEIVAEHVHPDMRGTVHRLDRIGKRLVRGGPLILRYAIWSSTVDAALNGKSSVALCYHNITPGEFLRDFNPSLAELCDRGRGALRVFEGRVEALIADSSFNASLVIVGADVGFENYHQALDVLVARIGASRVFFTGPISSEARDAWYRRADVYLSMSLHEGFCAPLIEAIAHGVPVIARDAGAQPETVGKAGVVLDGADLALVAEALHELASSRTTRRALSDAADERLTELRPDKLARRIRAALDPLLDGR
jgi:glycosyltransferase involved in cell wall biosynthesis